MSEIGKIKAKRSWNKTDLTEFLANEAQIPKVRAAQYINILTNTIAEALEKGKKVTISDFGTFQISERRSFDGRNPKTGDPLRVPVRRIPVFRAGKKLKNALNVPQIRECVLVDPKKIRLTFSKLMDEADNTLLTPESYEVRIDGSSIGPLKDVKIDKRGTWTRSNKNEKTSETLQGVASVILSCNKQLVGKDLQVLFRHNLSDIDGNLVNIDN